MDAPAPSDTTRAGPRVGPTCPSMYVLRLRSSPAAMQRFVGALRRSVSAGAWALETFFGPQTLMEWGPFDYSHLELSSSLLVFVAGMRKYAAPWVR